MNSTKFLPTILATAALLTLSAASFAQAPDWNKGTPEQQIRALSDIQPGVGTVMMEYSFRFTTMYYAAKGGNWGMAGYQMKEMPEIQEVGETTRPGRAPMLKDFENDFLKPLSATVDAKDWKAFKAQFTKTAEACNACHVDSKFEFIKYQLPKSSPSPTSVKP
jgi:hypothetical protein